MVCSKTNLFRALTGKEEEAVTLLDNRNVFDPDFEPNNSVLVVCDHASSDLKFMKPKEKEEGILRTNESHDRGVADFASALSERIECMAILANFSRLVIDPSVPICNSEIIRNHYLEEDLPVSINIDGYRLWERLSDFYLEYQKILREAMIFLDVP